MNVMDVDVFIGINNLTGSQEIQITYIHYLKISSLF